MIELISVFRLHVTSAVDWALNYYDKAVSSTSPHGESDTSFVVVLLAVKHFDSLQFSLAIG